MWAACKNNGTNQNHVLNYNSDHRPILSLFQSRLVLFTRSSLQEARECRELVGGPAHCGVGGRGLRMR